jgi:hypothetical protein
VPPSSGLRDDHYAAILAVGTLGTYSSALASSPACIEAMGAYGRTDLSFLLLQSASVAFITVGRVSSLARNVVVTLRRRTLAIIHYISGWVIFVYGVARRGFTWVGDLGFAVGHFVVRTLLLLCWIIKTVLRVAGAFI